jgi:hypothetical protein
VGIFPVAEVAGIFPVAEVAGIFPVAEEVGIFPVAAELPSRLLTNSLTLTHVLPRV